MIELFYGQAIRTPNKMADRSTKDAEGFATCRTNLFDARIFRPPTVSERSLLLYYCPVHDGEIGLYFFEARLPGKPLDICGLLLWDVFANKIVFEFRKNWHQCTEVEDCEILAGYEAHFRQMLVEMGSSKFLDYLESTLHNIITISTEYRLERPGEELDHYCTALARLLQVEKATELRKGEPS